MVSVSQLADIVKDARAKAKKRNFSQSVDLVATLKDIDVKKQELNINEVVYLPKVSKEASLCVFAAGDLALRARRSGADRVIEPEEIDKLSTDKRQLRKLSRGYSFFLAETSLMSKIGKVFGQYLGPKGKMPAPILPNAPIEAMIKRFRSATRVRSRGQLAVACKIGDEGMGDQDLAENAMAILEVVEKKLPSGTKNMRKVMIKMTMSEPATSMVSE